jgi:hypothetical protein
VRHTRNATGQSVEIIRAYNTPSRKPTPPESKTLVEEVAGTAAEFLPTEVRENLPGRFCPPNQQRGKSGRQYVSVTTAI